MRNKRRTPAITPITIPAIAPPLRPPLGALTPIIDDPSVPTGAMNPWVVVAAAVSVTVDMPLLVPRTGGVAGLSVAVAVGQAAADELPTTH